MNFIETPLKGACVIELEKRGDDRGFFARFYCEREYRQHGLNPRIVQINNAFSRHCGTLRGMHYQIPPRAEDKIFRCLRGAIFDVIIDLRPDSKTFLKHFAVELTADNRTMLYIPKNFAHGYLTLADDAETLYLVTEFYSPRHERGIRYNDPLFDIHWPMEPAFLSDKDRNLPDFNPATFLK